MLCEAVPEVAVSVKLYVPLAVPLELEAPPPQAARPQTLTRKAAKTIVATRAVPSLWSDAARRSRGGVAMTNNSNMASKTANNVLRNDSPTSKGDAGNRSPEFGGANIWPVACVTKVTVTSVGAPVAVNEVGETVQVDNAGAPVQARVTMPTNPPCGAMVT